MDPTALAALGDQLTRGAAPAVAAGATLGLGLTLAAALALRVPLTDPTSPRRLRRRTPASERVQRRRVLLALGAGLGALALTRWVVAGIGVALLVLLWERLAGSGAAERAATARLEGLAVWTESLRDTIAGAVGLEQAIPASAAAAPPAIRPSLNLLVDRLRIREPLPDALLGFADDLDDASADTAVAALVLSARLRGPGLRDVLTSLAVSTREELDMRRRVEAGRRSIRRSVRIVVVVVLGVIGLLAVFNRQYVAPYDGVLGQLVLVLVAGVFLAGLLWLRRLARPTVVDRLLGTGAR